MIFLFLYECILKAVVFSIHCSVVTLQHFLQRYFIRFVSADCHRMAEMKESEEILRLLPCRLRRCGRWKDGRTGAALEEGEQKAEKKMHTT